MRAILETSIQIRFLIAVTAAAAMILGITQLSNMPVDVLPEFSPPFVQVQTEALGLSAEEVEHLITVPLEQELLNGVAWLDTIRSESVPGLSSITMVFEPGTDLYRARQMVAERLAQTSVILPRVSKAPTMLQPTSASGRVLIVGLRSTKLSMIEMSVLTRWTITPRLMGVPGVANVATWGMRDKQLQVRVDPELLRANNVSLLRVLESVGNALWVSTLSFVEAATPGNAGFIDTPQQRLGIQHILPISSPQELARVPVPRGIAIATEAEESGTQSQVVKNEGSVRLMDIADVVEDHQPLIGDARDNSGAGLLLVIEKFPGSDTILVTRGVEDALTAMRPGLEGMEIDTTLYRPATYLETARANLIRAAIVAGVVVVLLFGLFFRNWRALLLGVFMIPFCLVIAAWILYWRGATLNVMVIAGLTAALAVIVNVVIVDLENLLRRFQNASDENENPSPRIVHALLETRGAMLFATLICLLVVLPVFSLQQTGGAFFQPLALSYALAILVSMLAALLITPALSAALFTKIPATSNKLAAPPSLRPVERSYEKILRRVFKQPRVVYASVPVLAVIAFVLLPFLRPALMPTFRGNDLLIRLNAAPGTSHPEMVRLVNRVAEELKTIPGVADVGAHIGRAVFGDQIVNINSAEVWLNLAPAANHSSTLDAIEAIIHSYPGLDGEALTYLQKLSSQVAPPPRAPIVVRIFGQDWETLRAQAEKMGQELDEINGVTQAAFAFAPDQPTVEVEVDLASAQRYGIQPGDVRRAASTLVNGIQVGNLFQDQKVFEVIVWSTPETRANLNDLKELLIDTPSGAPVRLGDVARVRIVPRPSTITHEDVSRFVDIDVSVKDRDAYSVMEDIKTLVAQYQFPLEYHAQVIGAFEAQQDDRNRFLAFALVACIGIFLVLQAALDSWRLAVLCSLMLPLALSGGLIALVVFGARELSLGALFGFVAVFGIAAHSQILLLRALHQQQVSHGMFDPEQIIEGMRSRVSSILMSALVIGSAFGSLLFFGDVPGLEILRSTALVIVGGLITGALIDLFALPVMYARFTQRARAFRSED